METLLTYGQDIMTIIGCLYTAALVIVKLTPTPKDDAAMTSVGWLITAICKVFGLTPAQGLRTDKPVEVAERPKAGG